MNCSLCFAPRGTELCKCVPVEIISFIFYLSGLILLKEIMDKVKKFSRFWIHGRNDANE